MLEALRPARLRGERLEDGLQVGTLEVRGGARRRTEVGDVTAGRQKQDAVAQVQALDAVRHAHDRASAVGQLTEHLHEAALETRIEPGCRLVEEQERRSGQHLGRDADAFALSARQRLDHGVATVGELELSHHLLDACTTFLA